MNMLVSGVQYVAGLSPTEYFRCTSEGHEVLAEIDNDG